MDTRDIYKLVRELSEERDDVVNLYDSMDIELSEDFVIETGVVGFTKDGVIIHLDEDAMEMLDLNGILIESEETEEAIDESVVNEDAVGSFKNKLSRSTDPFEMIYDAISGNYGDEIRDAMQEMYNDVVNDSGYRLHPDDDFEKIIGIVVDQLVDDSDMNEAKYGTTYGGKALAHPASTVIYKKIITNHPELLQMFDLRTISDACNEYAEDLEVREEHRYDPNDVSVWTKEVVDDLQSRNRELAEIKKLALGQEEVDEGLGKALLGGAALIAAITGINKMEADHLMKTEPQLVALAQMRQEAFVQNDEEKVKELDARIEKTMDHISVTGRPVMDIDGNPVDPREPVGEAEYQGRKVPLGKPMQGDVKKSKVYVKKPNGKVVKVNFGDKNMKIKKSNPGRRKSFRARHNCDNPGPRWKARYWSCRAW
jgi:hypothetical protein